eukprot:TRINITY_DN25726_c0_g1_i1.p1 TRINITY_DN25726_c0_g1~~TRINITY_DN25726_c0_g1_i1.p1  ORF type:complete len:136 (+),score=41.06 TRINITY_DN25726_c0_g1_i1:19-426(+)
MEGSSTNNSSGSSSVNVAPSTEEKETIEEFLSSMEDYVTAIPDDCVEYYLNKTGFICSDVKVKRVIALAAQKFVSDVAADAMQYSKVRQSGSGKEKKAMTKMVLNMEDLSKALKEYGVNAKRSDYYVDGPSSSKK